MLPLEALGQKAFLTPCSFWWLSAGFGLWPHHSDCHRPTSLLQSPSASLIEMHAMALKAHQIIQDNRPIWRSILGTTFKGCHLPHWHQVECVERKEFLKIPPSLPLIFSLLFPFPGLGLWPLPSCSLFPYSFLAHWACSGMTSRCLPFEERKNAGGVPVSSDWLSRSLPLVTG